MNLQEALNMYMGVGAKIKEVVMEQEPARLKPVENAITGRIRSGKKANGDKIGSYKTYKGNYSNRRVSNYSNWAEERMKKGLQVNYVDFSYTGGLLDALMVEYKEGKVRLVFKTIEDEVVAEQLDRMYGLGVFELSEQEEELLKSEVADMSRDIINNTIKQIL